ncbi:MAG: biotin transporter BioY [Firmicutes bacterium]|nr:biotin transporter BioY [Bacillota bacterium]
MKTPPSSESRTDLRPLTVTALLAALICVLGPLSVPLPFSPVPISFANLAILFAVMLAGWKRGTMACLIYLLLGLAGLPVFSAFSGGPGKLLGPTGGYLIGYLFLSLTAGLSVELADRFDRFAIRTAVCITGMILGTVILYLFGTTWLARQAGMTFTAALWAGVIPFIPGDLIKIIAAALIGSAVRDRLRRAGMLF